METKLANISTEDRKEIIQAYQKLLRASRNVLNWDDIKQIRKAIELSLEQAGFDRRLSGKLSVVHSLEVATIALEEIGLGRTSLICALLYDTVRKSDQSIDQIQKQFGSQVANIMDGLVKVFDLYQRNVSIQSENFRKLLLTFAQDVRVILIIIAERLQTIRTLDLYDRELQLKIASEISYLYAPMAHRLGLYTIKSEMEDLVMKYTNRDMYKFIAKKLNETKRAREKYIKEFIDPIKEELEQYNLKFDIKGRTKTIHSIFNKMQKQKVEFEQVYDLFAIRVILDSPQKHEKADCWKVYSVVADKYQPNPSRMRDWLSIPKSNGYESLHTTVLGPANKWVEVQIRSKRMDEVAERGLAAHWKYKGVKGDQGLDMWLANIRDILENPELNAVDFIDDFKLNLYDEEVFVFTPKGDLRRLPKGATVLDFAFDIHSEVGKKCAGARVNDKNVSIRHVLQNGDQVDIQTTSNQEPKQDWLQIVVTSKAKTKLKQALRDIQYKESELGRELLVRRLKNWKIDLSDQLTGVMVKHFKFKSVNDFFRDIALEKLDIVAIKEFIQQHERKDHERDHSDSRQSGRSAENFIAPPQDDGQLQGDDVLLIDKNLTNVDFKLAKCCNPIFGDEIFGFVSVSGGIRIHRNNCPNANEMHTKFSYRIIQARWTGEAGGSYLAAIKVVGEDDIGIVSNISQIISKELKLKTRSISVDSKEGLFEGTVSVFVNNNQILNTLIKKVKEVKGVLSVSRIDAVG
ncbi:RelA/SpoT family protein [Natronoflexus pectinivorans]|uniref:GTP pyrophosphokinase n=1 Tax=Natronoflexus pectinivorans TaxID=682526 RepID=A0A4V2RWM8_9BACT|nr:RelA/SpoT family protein [Natronoflexus pectinivorans]TCO09210.1 GTP pyrophosphokinase [Natronoflexus pectinivorans]